MCEDLREWMCEENVKEVRIFGLMYVRVDVLGKFIGVCEWCDDCERILIFLKVLNVTLQIYLCLLKEN